MSLVIDCQNIIKSYTLGDQKQRVLRGINLQLQENQSLAIMGPSGSGKSTLMNILGLLDKPCEGQYILHKQVTQNLNDAECAKIRNRNIGFVFQSFHLLSRLTALQNVCLPLQYQGLEKRAQEDRAQTLLAQVGLGALLHHKPNQLSGGQQQRVAIARALSTEPKLLLADEPTGALDSKTGEEILNLLLNYQKQTGLSLIIVTHDKQVANRCQRVIELQDGVICHDYFN